MKRMSWLATVVVIGLTLGSVVNVCGAQAREQLVSEAGRSIDLAASAVEEARVAIAGSKQMLASIPEDSPLLDEVVSMLMRAKENWAVAVAALDGARESASKISAASSAGIAQDYKMLASVNASVALSGAKAVQTGLMFVEAAAENKTEALGIIRVAVEDSLEAASMAQLSYERFKGFIAEKYSK